MSGLPASDYEIEQMLELLASDLAATKAAKYRDAMPATALEVRECWDCIASYDIARLTEKVVEDVQQDLMDTYIDSTWPACPRHPNHPLWYHDGAWHCERDGEALTKFGGLSTILPVLEVGDPQAPGAFVRKRKKA